MSETTVDSHQGNNLNFVFCFVFNFFYLKPLKHKKTKHNETQDMLKKNKNKIHMISSLRIIDLVILLLYQFRTILCKNIYFFCLIFLNLSKTSNAVYNYI